MERTVHFSLSDFLLLPCYNFYNKFCQKLKKNINLGLLFILTYVKKFYILIINPNLIAKITSLWQSPSKNPNQIQPQPPHLFVFIKRLYEHFFCIRGDEPLFRI